MWQRDYAKTAAIDMNTTLDLYPSSIIASPFFICWAKEFDGVCRGNDGEFFSVVGKIADYWRAQGNENWE